MNLPARFANSSQLFVANAVAESINVLLPFYDLATTDPIEAITKRKANCAARAAVAYVLLDEADVEPIFSISDFHGMDRESGDINYGHVITFHPANDGGIVLIQTDRNDAYAAKTKSKQILGKHKEFNLTDGMQYYYDKLGLGKEFADASQIKLKDMILRSLGSDAIAECAPVKRVLV